MKIDAALRGAGWVVQDRREVNLSASRGVAVREFPLKTGEADYLLFVDGKASGVLEAKPEGHALSGVEVQAEKYGTGLPASLDAPLRPLPFQYLKAAKRPSRAGLRTDRKKRRQGALEGLRILQGRHRLLMSKARLVEWPLHDKGGAVLFEGEVR